ncbi:ABC transporter ATP-binding protein [Rubellimicrobium arenae]|uniref:ABC transporter ATP-binding protein n=1 Tax=Rubellimicrobium arenae TaxID=2817372 RepID=UPI001B30F2A2|nr:ABC transporter ATP-binding protein [Rubellimicrobium arenae]
MTYLVASGLQKAYGRTAVLSDVAFEVAQGEFICLLGPSGCGKSTLLRLLAGLIEPDDGRLMLAGEDLTRRPAWHRDIGLVFQNYALFPHLSVARNVAFGLEMRGLPKAEAKSRVAEALELVDLADYRDRLPSELSGGQQQRVAIARAIAVRPRLLLLDEPLSNLDALLRGTVRADLRDLHRRTGLTTIMVTHDQAEALSLADRVAVMSGGRIVQMGSPETIYASPDTTFVASFVGNPPANLLRLPPDGIPGWTPPPPLAAAIANAGSRPLVLALWPETLQVVERGHAHSIPATLRAVEFLGAERRAHLRLTDGQTLLAHPGEQGEGDVGVVLRGNGPLPTIFDAETGARLIQVAT